MSMSKLFASVAVAALLTTPAFAQTSTSPSPSTSRPSTSAPSGAPASRALPSDIGSMKVSELVGKNVYTANDEKIGDVNDVVTPKSGGPAMAVIGVGGFLGIGEKEAAVPIDQLKVQGDKIVVSGATKESLKAHADYKKDEHAKVDRDMVISQAGGGMSRPSPSGSTSSPSGSSSTGATGTTTSPSGSSPSGSAGTSGSSGSGSSSSGSMGSGSSSTGGSAPAGNAPSGGGSSTQTPKQ